MLELLVTQAQELGFTKDRPYWTEDVTITEILFCLTCDGLFIGQNWEIGEVLRSLFFY